MKPAIIALFVASMVTVLADDSKDSSRLKEGEQWILPDIAYGQYRMVPSRIIPHITSIEEWNGPWGGYKHFTFLLNFSKGQQTLPRNYHFVDPRVEFQGTDSTTIESSYTTVRLFDRESRESDIKITFHPPPDKVEFNKEYHGATIFGEDSIVTWKIFVRFTTEKPNYIRASRPTKTNES